jgi:cytosine/adenosine deaminase-related metal-dependent hydrolase
VQVYSADWVLPVEGVPIRDGAVAVENGRIARVGTAEELGTGTRYECAAILPGFVNAHTHLEYAVYGGFGDGLADFAEWIALHVRRKDRIGWDEFVAIARLGAAECLASGITTVGDCSYSGAAARACDELGLRAIVYLEVFGADPDGALARFESMRERVADSFSERVQLGVSPHAPYTVTLDVYRACGSLGVPVQTHLSESRSELRYLADGSGPWGGYRQLLVPPAHTTGPRMLAEAGLLDERWSAAHCVEVEPDEIELLAATGTGVVHCPRSNGLLGCGAAPVAALRAAGVRLGVGTDSPASAPSFDPFEELRTALVVARSRERTPEALTATEALTLATLGSARALGLEREIGSLAAGKRADLTVVSLDGSSYHPWEDPAAAVVFGGSPDRVITTLVDGEARYERGGFEWHELRQRAASARSRMLAAAPSAVAAGS